MADTNPRLSGDQVDNLAQPLRMAILVFEGMSMFHMAAPTVVLSDISGLYQAVYVAENPGELTLSSGLPVSISQGVDEMLNVDLVIIPSWHSSLSPPSEQLLHTLRCVYHAKIPLVGLCLGAFLLAELGVLNGRKATTHWAFVDEFVKRFPDIHWDADVLYVDHSDVLTSAGTAAAIDCCLQIVRNRRGGKVAAQVARALVMPAQRTGEQAQFIASPVPNNKRDSALSTLIDYVSNHLHEPHSINRLAERLSMSRRTFTRHFQKIMGKSFGEWLLQQRLLFAQQLLESSSASVDMVAEQAGFGSSVNFRMQFKKHIGVTPNAWRNAHSHRYSLFIRDEKLE